MRQTVGKTEIFRALPPRRWNQASLGVQQGHTASQLPSQILLFVCLSSSTVLLAQGGWGLEVALSLALGSRAALSSALTVLQFPKASAPVSAVICPGDTLSSAMFWGTQAIPCQMACGQNCWKTQSLRQSPSILSLTTGIQSRHAFGC